MTEFRLSIQFEAQGESRHFRRGWGFRETQARWACQGTHKGDLGGIAPTGKQFTISGVTVARFADGTMTEDWVNWDALGLMQQLGIVPELAKTKAAAR